MTDADPVQPPATGLPQPPSGGAAPGAAKARRVFIALALCMGTLVGLAAGELATRVMLTWRARGRLAADFSDIPRNPNVDLPLQRMIYDCDDPDMIYRLKPGVVGMFLGKPYRTNALGFRYREMEQAKPAKPAGALRVACLGDSYMFGWGVGQDESLPARLESSLGRVLPGRRVEMVNMGVPGYNAWMEAAMLEKVALKLQPDMILLQYHVNDATLPLFLARHDYMTRLDRLFLPQLFDVLRGRREAPQWNEARVVEPTDGPGPLQPDPADVPPDLARTVGNAAVRRAYARMAALCRDRGVKFYVIFPTDDAFSAWPSATRDPHFDWMRGLCAELKIPVIETFPLDHAFVVEHRLPLDAMFDNPRRDFHPSVIRLCVWVQAALPPVARALAGDAVTTQAIQAEIARLRAENEPRVAAWRTANPRPIFPFVLKESTPPAKP